MIQILLTTYSGIVQIDYQEPIEAGKTINDVLTNFLLKGDSGMPVSLRDGDRISINKLPAQG